MSDTPRTDEQELAYEAEDGSTYVHTTFARELERENNELRKDNVRLEMLNTQCEHDLKRSHFEIRELRLQIQQLRQAIAVLNDEPTNSL